MVKKSALSDLDGRRSMRLFKSYVGQGVGMAMPSRSTNGRCQSVRNFLDPIIPMSR